MKNAKKLVSKLDEVSDDTIPFFTSDKLHHYERALLRTYGVVREVPTSRTAVCSGGKET